MCKQSRVSQEVYKKKLKEYKEKKLYEMFENEIIIVKQNEEKYAIIKK